MLSLITRSAYFLKATLIETSIEDSLVGNVVSSEEDAFKLYNDHEFRLGFSIYQGNQRFKARWMKFDKVKGEKAYTKVDFCTGCKAMIEFRLNDESGWTVSTHDVSHNHGFCDVNESLMDNFGYHNDNWLNRLYNLRKKWCLAFSKDLFSGDVLSSQRSEATNYAISRRLSKTLRCIIFIGYLIKLFLNRRAMQTWKIFVAILDKCILKRWTKDIDLSLGSSSVCDVGKISKKDIAGYSAWRRQMLRIFSDLIFASKLNINAWECVEEGSRMMKDKISSEVEAYYLNNSNVGPSNNKDPVGRRAKGERNKRKKSIVEIKCNQIRGKRKSALMRASIIKTAIQLSVNNEVLGRDLNFTSSECELV
ncbi:hypothetical protein M9H77_35892 [Catharanthus roseus]|uniref:Uncharacterized protein n=1 Tax=Catharanthus roseus TaxID=4058 RepID=A0ACB9ZSH6_CATRO|nr:hypothetical protein M9H77_35892 [Catharanthus roseus]